MATWHNEITDKQADLIRKADLFFVATADPELRKGPEDAGPVNVSPKGGVPPHIIDRNRVASLDYTGSGNETARHSAAGGPITLMVCSFEQENAAIVRLCGSASVTPVELSRLKDRLLESPAPDLHLPERLVIEIVVERIITSCGCGIPVIRMVRQRVLGDRARRYKYGRSKSSAGPAKPG